MGNLDLDIHESCFEVVLCYARLLAHFSIIVFEIHFMEMNRRSWTNFACVVSVVSVYLPIMGTFLHCVLKIFSREGDEWKILDWIHMCLVM